MSFLKPFQPLDDSIPSLFLWSLLSSSWVALKKPNKFSLSPLHLLLHPPGITSTLAPQLFSFLLPSLSSGLCSRINWTLFQRSASCHTAPMPHLAFIYLAFLPLYNLLLCNIAGFMCSFSVPSTRVWASMGSRHTCFSLPHPASRTMPVTQRTQQLLLKEGINELINPFAVVNPGVNILPQPNVGKCLNIIMLVFMRQKLRPTWLSRK